MYRDAEYHRVRNSICMKSSEELDRMLDKEMERASDDESTLQLAIEDELSARAATLSDPAEIGRRQHEEDFGY